MRKVNILKGVAIFCGFGIATISSDIKAETLREPDSQEPSDLIINEVMQSNIDCILDELNEFPDSWIELYNPTDNAISLGEYKIGNGKKSEKAYSLPADVSVPPHSYIIIYCDKEGSGMHTDFRVDSGKETIYLFKNDEAIESVELATQPSPNISYGRESDGSAVWGYQLVPSPASANEGGISDLVLGNPIFSEPGRVGTTPLFLSLSVPEEMPENTIIRYTLDGSEPTFDSPVYDSPINIEESTVVRARLFCVGAISPRSTTHSYIFHPREMTLPIISVVTNDEFIFGEELGILSDATTYDGEPNYMHNWRRPVNLEYFAADDQTAEMNQICETRIKGKTSRTYMMKPLVFYANKRFGTKRFEYEFFPEQKPGLKEFKSFEARNSGNDAHGIYMRDALSQYMMGMNCDLDWQAWQPAVFYINGKYHGLLNIRERSNDDYIYSNFDGLEDVDVIENWVEIVAGTADNYNEFSAFYSEEDHTYEEYAERMDIDEFQNYIILEQTVANYDFPNNNMVMWRPSAEGGKWRWISKDLDDSLGIYVLPFDMDYIDFLTNLDSYPQYSWARSEESTVLFRHLMEFDEFKEAYCDKSLVYLGDFLHPDRFISTLHEKHELVLPEWDDHVAKNTPSYYNYDSAEATVIDFIRKRGEIQQDLLAPWFGFDKTISVKVSDIDKMTEGIEIQDIPLMTGVFDGKYFCGKEMKIEGKGENFALNHKWIVEVYDEEDNYSKSEYDAPTFSFVVPDAKRVEIYPVESEDTNGLTDIETETVHYEWVYYTTQGLRVDRANLRPGIYIRSNGEKTEKIMIK